MGLNMFVAMKVKHPGINEKVKKFNLIKKIIKFINPFISFGDIILQYIDNINLQTSFGLVTNCTKESITDNLVVKIIIIYKNWSVKPPSDSNIQSGSVILSPDFDWQRC